jgi:hypothetical protein
LDKWDSIATLPAAIAAGSVAIATFPAAVYLFGGWDFNGNSLRDVWRYNILLNQWDSVGSMPGLPRNYAIFWGFDSVVIGGGGQTSDNISAYNLGNDFYKYDFSKKLWTSVIFENSFDSTGGGATFVYKKRGCYFGGFNSITPNYVFSNKMWSFDASKYLSDTPTGIAEIKKATSFSVYPNPVIHDKSFSISTSESGEVSFYDALGRSLGERKLDRGINSIRLDNISEVIFYKTTFSTGEVRNGRLVIY